MIVCANCRNCRSFFTVTHTSPVGCKEHRIRCAAGRYRRPASRTPKDFAFRDASQLMVESCDDYDSMNDAPESTDEGRVELDAFLLNLKGNAPRIREFRTIRIGESAQAPR